MNKLFFLILCLATLDGFSQPTITSTDLPFAGFYFTTGTDSTYNAAIPAGGANQNWNYSSLVNLLTDTAGFMPATGTPYAATFSGSNLSGYDRETNSYSYFTANSTGFFIDGFGSSGGNFVLNPGQCFVPVPFTFGNTSTNVARNIVDTMYTDTSGTTYTVRNIINITSHFNADGYGSLTLPNAVYQNTLRVRITETRYDSLYALVGPVYILIRSSATQFTYFRWFEHGGQASYLLGIKADSLGNNALSSEYLMASAVLQVPKTESNHQLTIYPNPAVDQITLNRGSNSEPGLISIYTSNGQLVFEQTWNSDDELTLDLKCFAGGYYILNFKSNMSNRTIPFVVTQY